MTSSQFTVTGTLTITYDKNDGTKGFASEVIVNDIQLLDSKPQQAAAPAPGAPNPNPPFYNQQRSQAPGAPAPGGYQDM